MSRTPCKVNNRFTFSALPGSAYPVTPVAMTSLTENTAGTQTLERGRLNTTLLLKLFRWVSVYINCRYLYVSHRFVCVHVCLSMFVSKVYVFAVVRPNKQLICSATSNMLLLLHVPKNKLRMFSL